MFYNGTNWVTENVTPTATGGKWNSLAVNSNGNPRISYYDVLNGPNQGSLRYTKRTPTGQWQISIVDESNQRWYLEFAYNRFFRISQNQLHGE